MIEIVTPATIPAAFTNLVLDHLKIDDQDEDPAFASLIDAYVEAAVSRVEAMSGRRLFTQELKLTADKFGTAIALPASPVASVSSVTYVDPDGATQTLAASAYALIDKAETPTLYPVYGTDWPDVRDFPGVVTVTFVAGYGAASSDVPAPLRLAVMQTVADWYRFGGNVATTSTMELPESAYRACMSYRREWA